jgi:hypothetical protein
LPLALAGLLLAPLLGHAASRAAASTPRPVVLVNVRGTALTPTTLLPALCQAAAPVTVAWKVAAADTAGIRSSFAVALTDARGRTRAALVRMTRAGRASATKPAACARGCYLNGSVSAATVRIAAGMPAMSAMTPARSAPTA